MSRVAQDPASIVRAAAQRKPVAMPAPMQGLSAALVVMPGAAGVHHLVDAKTGERLGCSIDAGVLERTRIFFR